MKAKSLFGALAWFFALLIFLTFAEYGLLIEVAHDSKGTIPLIFEFVKYDFTAWVFQILYWLFSFVFAIRIGLTSFHTD